MAKIVSKKIVLTGPLAGKTIAIGGLTKYLFHNGEMLVEDTLENIEKMMMYFSYWQAELRDPDDPPDKKGKEK